MKTNIGIFGLEIVESDVFEPLSREGRVELDSLALELNDRSAGELIKRVCDLKAQLGDIDVTIKTLNVRVFIDPVTREQRYHLDIRDLRVEIAAIFASHA